MIKIPYGESDFKGIIEGGYFNELEKLIKSIPDELFVLKKPTRKHCELAFLISNP